MFFWDTYALIEAVEGSPNYSAYADIPLITTRLNLMELYYAFLRKGNQKRAEKYFAYFRPACTKVTDSIIKEAMRFRRQQRSERNLISYVDCVGYVTALHLGIPFLSGEKHFKNLSNVEFVQ